MGVREVKEGMVWDQLMYAHGNKIESGGAETGPELRKVESVKGEGWAMEGGVGGSS